MKSLVWFITGASRGSVWKPLVPHLSAATLSFAAARDPKVLERGNC
jgi:hypothetical protein